MQLARQDTQRCSLHGRTHSDAACTAGHTTMQLARQDTQASAGQCAREGAGLLVKDK